MSEQTNQQEAKMRKEAKEEAEQIIQAIQQNMDNFVDEEMAATQNAEDQKKKQEFEVWNWYLGIKIHYSFS
jgi:hypothetical protein